MAGPSPSAAEVAAMEKDPLIKMAECRICQEEDPVDNLESPCACNGSLKFVHRMCVQRWCNEKGDTICEICHMHYQPNYMVIRPPPEEIAVDISGWTVSNASFDLHDASIFAMAEAERQYSEAEYNDHRSTNANGFLCSVVLIVMVLLLMRYTLALTDSDEADSSEDEAALFSLLSLRICAFLLPCYIMAWAVNIMQHRRQEQEATGALTATRFAFVLHTDPTRERQFARAVVAAAAPPNVIPHQETV